MKHMNKVFEEKPCPVCAQEGKNTMLQLCQINLNEAVYICKELKCTYPNGYKCTFVNRDVFAVPESDNDCDSDIERITQMFTERAEKKIKKRNEDQNSDNVLSLSESSSDDAVVEEAFNLLKRSIYPEKEVNDKSAEDSYENLLNEFLNVSKKATDLLTSCSDSDSVLDMDISPTNMDSMPNLLDDDVKIEMPETHTLCEKIIEIGKNIKIPIKIQILKNEKVHIPIKSLHSQKTISCDTDISKKVSELNLTNTVDRLEAVPLRNSIDTSNGLELGHRSNKLVDKCQKNLKDIKFNLGKLNEPQKQVKNERQNQSIKSEVLDSNLENKYVSKTNNIPSVKKPTEGHVKEENLLHTKLITKQSQTKKTVRKKHTDNVGPWKNIVRMKMPTLTSGMPKINYKEKSDKFNSELISAALVASEKSIKKFDDMKKAAKSAAAKYEGFSFGKDTEKTETSENSETPNAETSNISATDIKSENIVPDKKDCTSSDNISMPTNSGLDPESAVEDNIKMLNDFIDHADFENMSQDTNLEEVDEWLKFLL